ncbi:MAG: hypothetical protein K2I30_01825 [Clostridia bacterium]|nr:hypothetical protein [Clostridia bacterium]
MEKQEVLNELYALRAGLSAISQEYDKAQAIDGKCDEVLAANAEDFCGGLICYDCRMKENDGKIYFHGLEKLQNRYGYIEGIEKKIQNGEITEDETVKATKSWASKIDENNLKGKKAFNRWLADDECDAYFNSVLLEAQKNRHAAFCGDISNVNYKKESKRKTKRSVIFFCVAAVFAIFLALMFAGAFGKWNEGIADILTLVCLIIVAAALIIAGLVYLGTAKAYKTKYQRELTEADSILNSAQWLLDNLPQNKKKTREILKEKDDNIAPIKQSCNEFYAALAKHFNPLLDERDWQNLDLVIFELETRRADTVKEALQLVDRELQTERIQQTIVQATKQICYEIRRGFSELKSTIINCTKAICSQLFEVNMQLTGISRQLSELTDGVNLSNALQAKANVTSAQLLNDVQTIRYYQ